MGDGAWWTSHEVQYRREFSSSTSLLVALTGGTEDPCDPRPCPLHPLNSKLETKQLELQVRLEELREGTLPKLCLDKLVECAAVMLYSGNPL